MTVRVGVIAEDNSDIDVIDAILTKLAGKPYAIRGFVGHGCGKILGKCQAWARDLKSKGCTLLIVVHDLDSRRLQTFRHELVAALGASPIPNAILVIPVREIEAWLLADHEAIGRVFKPKKAIKMVPNPESIGRPKEYLRDLIYRVTDHRTIYVNTVHNRLIAKQAAADRLKRCASYLKLHEFVETHL